MKSKSRSNLIITLLLGYIFLQFLWWEVLLVRQTMEVSAERQKIAELSISDPVRLGQEIAALQNKKKMRIWMIAGEGTVFLLLLLYAVYRVKKYNDQEAELTRRHKNFLLSITHELKTPLSATKLQLQTLRKHELDEKKKNELLENALRETERLNKLIDNVLLASRIDAERMQLNKEQVNISELIQSLANIYYKPLLNSGELEINTEDNIYLETDKLVFPSLVLNLVDNAIKYSSAKMEVKVFLKKSGDKIYLSVSDQGCGINDGEKNLVFAKFYRSGNEEVRSSKGTGLGLFIVKNICEAHKARISFQPNQPCGTIFNVEF